ncbi:TauD/TfdA dioxygenase family protein [Caenimonas soli]|uniref:TauD/TfdA dioxygenase family protein n=1 Tax=Caenimonas soli TaxID=2735555 RepID=UPI0015545E03|nr:TauD/TfdA family dioxygenase [Caenimonas soli]NPC59128.1 TauD/TfdA family dioxygenase [Caenimonas soli]
MEVRKLDAPLGAEIVGIDLRKPVSDSQFEAVAKAFAENGVIVFRAQDITPQQHIDFSRRFGELEVLKFYAQYLHKDHPEIFVVSNIVENGKSLGLPDAGRVWHTDVSYKGEPSLGSLLYAREVPHREGKPLGDTMFATMISAFDALPTDMQSKLSNMTASHRLDEKRYTVDLKTQKERGKRAQLTDEQRKMIKDVHHPIARTHPVTGKKCLYINELFTVAIDGLDPTESDELLAQLCQHATQQKFIYRHRWAVGDLLMWDNCSTQHLAVGDYAPTDRRLMHRTTVRGSVPF